ncbi:unnamed protein product [Didymodactylos carnosus]|uniref:Uncharacterized protein n=1 Tax=Didymodactylos carnosus TaxID=1234261 RepID=A0A8S2DLG7_9BILA|nr:unnamed protein product [Didymodactylos carnosus]CAF3743746.1 unnamed protein product [Didymodactylos carnosus]
MACPSGCLNGGGQIRASTTDDQVKLLEKVTNAYESLPICQPENVIKVKDTYDIWKKDGKYYREYGNPNYNGTKGLISRSKKRELNQASNKSKQQREQLYRDFIIQKQTKDDIDNHEQISVVEETISKRKYSTDEEESAQYEHHQLETHDENIDDDTMFTVTINSGTNDLRSKLNSLRKKDDENNQTKRMKIDDDVDTVETKKFAKPTDARQILEKLQSRGLERDQERKSDREHKKECDREQHQDGKRDRSDRIRSSKGERSHRSTEKDVEHTLERKSSKEDREQPRKDTERDRRETK